MSLVSILLLQCVLEDGAVQEYAQGHLSV